MKSKIVLAYFGVFIFFSIIYIALFKTPVLNTIVVLFYRGNLLLLATFLICLLIITIFKKRLAISWETLFAALIMSASIHLAIFVVFPVTFDRSVTMYLLNRLNTSRSPTCQGLSAKQMENLLIKEYVKRDQAIFRRIQEQSVINMLEQSNQCVSLTPRGQGFLKFSKFLKALYNIN